MAQHPRRVGEGNSSMNCMAISPLVRGNTARRQDRRCKFAEADERKELFAHHLIAYVPLAAHIRQVLDARPDHRAPFSRFREELEDHMGTEQAEVLYTQYWLGRATPKRSPITPRVACSSWREPWRRKRDV